MLFGMKGAGQDQCFEITAHHVFIVSKKRVEERCVSIIQPDDIRLEEAVTL